MSYDVLVVGGGLAGLACARDLARAGTDVLLVEARERVGGRVEGVVLDDGRTVQMGGEIVGEVHHAYLGLAAELGLELVPSYVAEPGEPGFDLLEGAHVGEDWMAPEDHAALERIGAEVIRLARDVDPADPWSHPDADRLDRLSRGRLARELGVTPLAYRRMQAQMASAAGGSIERVSVLGECRAVAAAGGKLQSDYEAWEALKVAGGSSVLPATLERELAGRIRYDAPVTALHVGRPCRVTLAGGEQLEADAIVCCVPVGPLRAIAVDGVSDARLASLHRQRQLRAFKAVLAFDEPVWRRVECNGLIESEHDVGGFWVQGSNTLSSLSGPEQLGYLEAAPDGVATEVLLASLERVVGPVAPRAVLWRRWGMDPYTLGYVSHWAPGDLMAVGPLHGTHEPPFYVAGSDHWACGYMEGAVATGRGAARAVLTGERADLYPARS
jgi:monoamine oxidase